MIVVDTNLICYRWMSSPNSAAAETALAKDPHWIAPLLWRSEFPNILAIAIRKKALTIDAAQEIMRKLRQVSNAASLPFRLMLFCDWSQGLTAQPTNASSSLLQTRNGFSW